MADTVVDSSIITDYLRGRTEAKLFLDSLRQQDRLAAHVVVQAEVITGARDLKEQRVIERLFQWFRVVPFNEQDASESIGLLKEYRLSHGVGWLDCLIAATCLRCKLPLTTLNEKHFRVFSELEVQRPYA